MISRGALNHRSSGFTLIEVVVALVISAILAGFVAMMVGVPVDAYMDQSERAQLTQSAATISRSLAQDLRNVLPNSVRIRNVGDRSIIEMLQVDAMSFYVPAGAYEAAGQPANLDHEFASTPGDRFRLYGRVNIEPPLYLVTGHSGASGASAYEMQNVIAAGFNLVEIAPGEDEITLSSGFAFTNVDSLRRMFWVSRPVTYICNADAGTLRVYRDYPITSNMPTSEASSQLSSSSARSALLADNLASCSFTCGAGGTSGVCNEWLRFEAALIRETSSGDETVRVFEQIALND